MPTSIALRLSRLLARHACRNMLPLRGPAGVVSFTFDDVPASACEAGAAALERHGARGTFYAAGGLTDQLEEGKPCHSEAQLRRLLADGHEVGCHSYSHIRCDILGADRLNAELERNARFLENLGVDTRRLDFAYPFGAYALGAKQICNRRFRSSRITGGGPHYGEVDLNAIQTYRLYAETAAPSYEELLAQTAARKGWLVLNTHDVENPPSRFGYTPENLEQAVKAALDAGCKVLPVGAAIDYWESQAG
ncbi:polysaccharide deacetylase family protein [Herbaspirillum sp.]|uniref:polysaccharide deacetylase family protein n=1 Tax=Herbaspirillum sp. TaxID=1890675 RepID=UPI001B1A9A70|nr:polysaccharide deacetylase family protein [Herbaspirillum sp.]MBO9535760.1 polysaccharide deacetylase family protein [Herbaspirillum sp.]